MAAGAVAATMLVAGCSLFGGDDDAPATTTTSTSTTTTTAPPVARSQAPELLDAGDEPRQPLRVAYSEGDEAEITFTSDLQVTQQNGDRTQRLDSPPIAQTLTYTVGRVSDEGAQLTVRIDAIAAKGKGTGLSGEELDALDEELEPLVGTEGNGLVTPLGELQDFVFDVPDGLPDDLAAQLDALQDQIPALGPALPAEPVGVGASWRTTSTSSAGGAEVETVSTINVTGIEDGLLRYTSTIRTSAEPQDILLAGLAEGTIARLESSDLQGSSTGAMGLDRVAISLRTQLSGSQAITLTTDAGATELTQSLEIAYVAGPAGD
ncbi:hypothetical protein ACE2AJ_10255 [Aquihabitans daechungensis]|uniref:hypothetical protein n=1 Tax=Aquihabitans daechungensis TaxID=1052257 RepID=UPI003BA378FE